MTQSLPDPLPLARLEQLRRDARRLRRGRTLSHNEALDAIAARYGFPNWSLLAKRAVPEGDRAQADPPVQHSTPDVPVDDPEMRMPIRMDASRSELALILAIVKRFEGILGAAIEVDRWSRIMDLEACHCNGCPLDLEALLRAPRDQDLVHDVAGIARHLNRETGKLEDAFTPRYAARAVELAP